MTVAIRPLDYVVIAAYVAWLVAMGLVTRRLNANLSDDFRNGCRGTWWLFGVAWPFQVMLFANFGTGILAVLCTLPFWHTASAEYRARSDALPLTLATSGEGNPMKIQPRFLRHAALAVALSAATASAAPPTVPAVCFWNPQAVADLRDRVRHNDPAVADAVAALKADTAKRMSVGPFSVTDKTLVPPSGDKHDLSTLGRYYWPDPKTSDGLPWVVIDGKTNPDYFNGKTGDTQRLFDFYLAVVSLSRTAYFADDAAAGERATVLLRTWFIDPATRMNPNARYAARLPGKWDGRAFGILSTVRPLTDILDAVELLQASGHLLPADRAALVVWFGQYLDWLTTSDFGHSEAGEKNNHGTAYDILVTRIALFTGQPDLARQTLEAARHRRIDAQVEPDGSQPLELHRTKPWDYTRYNIEFMFRLAMLGDVAGVDLWRYRSNDGRSVRGALDYLIGQVIHDGKVDPEALKGADVAIFGPLLQTAARVYGDARYLDVMRQIGFDGKLSLINAGLVNGMLDRGGPIKDKSNE